MKKILSIILSCIMVSIIPFTSNADEISKNTYEINNITVQFQDDSVFNTGEQEDIADFLVNGEKDVQVYNLLCTIFGHKYETEIVTTITHKVNPTAPRCLKEHFKISVCSRCGDKKSELLDYDYIYCCS